MSSRGERSSVSRLLAGASAAIARPLVWQGPNGGPPSDSAPGPDAKTGATGQRTASDNGESRDQQHVQVLMEQQAKIQELEKQLESRPRQAYEQGYNEGQAAATKQATARVDPVLAKLATSIQDLVAVRKRHLVESEVDTVKLAMAVARRILHRELSVDSESILGVVKATVERVDSRDVHRIRMHPDDVPALQRQLSSLNLPPRVELAPDKTLERGGVIVETSRGSMDASISSQLAEIERGLVDIVRRSN